MSALLARIQILSILVVLLATGPALAASTLRVSSESNATAGLGATLQQAGMEEKSRWTVRPEDLRILLIEDDDALRITLKELIGDIFGSSSNPLAKRVKGATQVLEASNVLQADTLLKSHTPHLLITDAWVRPSSDGRVVYDVIAAARQANPQVVVRLLTASSPSDGACFIAKLRDRGIHDVKLILKPAPYTVFERLVSDLIAHLAKRTTTGLEEAPIYQTLATPEAKAAIRATVQRFRDKPGLLVIRVDGRLLSGTGFLRWPSGRSALAQWLASQVGWRAEDNRIDFYFTDEGADRFARSVDAAGPVARLDLVMAGTPSTAPWKVEIAGLQRGSMTPSQLPAVIAYAFQHVDQASTIAVTDLPSSTLPLDEAFRRLDDLDLFG